MIIGVPKEIQENENRVAITPVGVYTLVKSGHEVLIEKSAGLGSAITDEEFEQAGAKIVDSSATIYSESDLIYKVSEPVPSEFPLIKENQIIFSFLYLVNQPKLTDLLLEKKVISIAYDTVQYSSGLRPLLAPMSEIGGKMAIQIGAHFLETANNGRGILLGGAPGVPPANVVIIGGGIVGQNAAKIAIGFGANVTIIDRNIDRMRYLESIFGASITTLRSYEYNIANAVKDADLLIGAVSITATRPPILVTEEMVKTMKKGSVIIDVDIDNGGSIETIDRISTLENPIYEKYGVLHYSVCNIPSSVPYTSTYALSNSTLPYLLDIVGHGWAEAIKNDSALAKGVNTAYGMVTNKSIADANDKEYVPLACLWDY